MNMLVVSDHLCKPRILYLLAQAFGWQVGVAKFSQIPEEEQSTSRPNANVQAPKMWVVVWGDRCSYP